MATATAPTGTRRTGYAANANRSGPSEYQAAEAAGPGAAPSGAYPSLTASGHPVGYADGGVPGNGGATVPAGAALPGAARPAANWWPAKDDKTRLRSG